MNLQHILEALASPLTVGRGASVHCLVVAAPWKLELVRLTDVIIFYGCVSGTINVLH